MKKMMKKTMKTNRMKVELKLTMMTIKRKMQAILKWMLRQMMLVSYKIKTLKMRIMRTLRKFN